MCVCVCVCVCVRYFRVEWLEFIHCNIDIEQNTTAMIHLKVTYIIF